jgi:hypothetical protein
MCDAGGAPVSGGAGKLWGGEETEVTAGSSSQSLKQQQQEALAQQVSRLLWSRFFSGEIGIHEDY